MSSFSDFLHSFLSTTTTTATSTLSFNLSSSNNTTLSNSNQYDSKTSNIISIIVVSLEIVLIVVIFLVQLFRKLASNDFNLKRSWFKPKSLGEYRRRSHSRAVYHTEVENAIKWVAEQQLRAADNIESVESSYYVSSV